MNTFKKTFAVFFILFFTAATVRADQDDRNELAEQTEAYAAEFLEMMTLLLDDYAGRELTPSILYEAALRGMANELDAFSEYMSAGEFKNFTDSLSGRFEGIGVQIDTDGTGYTRVVNVIPGSPAEEAGVLNGDFIIKINGDDVGGFSQYQIVEMIKAITGDVELAVKRNGDEHTFTMTKRTVTIEPVEVLMFEDIFSFAGEKSESIRYVYLASFDMESSSAFRNALRRLTAQHVKGIVLDMRGNSGGYLDQVVAIARMILPEGPIYYEMDSSGGKVAHYSRLKNPPFEHVVVLTDRFTASAAELLAAALQDSKIATVVGETTYGKGVIQTSVDLSTGGAFKYTYAEYLRRSGEKIDRIGVVPDVYAGFPDALYGEIVLDGDGASDQIVTLKNILAFLGYDIDDFSSVYDEKTRGQVKVFKNISGLEGTDELDGAFAYALNDLLYTVYNETDVVLETGYNILLEAFDSATNDAPVVSLK